MVTRNDVIVDWHLSPRIITVESPSTEIIIQDLHDTLRDLEQEIDNIIYTSIVSTAGKEPLGGGVTVGLTATLLDAQLSFEKRTDEFDSGTATGGSVITLVDAGADFVATGVLRGDLIANFTDGSHSTVIAVTDSTNLSITSLSGGVADIFASGDVYQIWHITQCDISGGNLVAVDSADLEIDPVFPTFGTQVIRTSSSSATLQELTSIQHSSFDGAVHIDTVNGVDTLNFPGGTPLAPVKTLAFAKTIAVANGFNTIQIVSSAFTIGATDNVDDFIIHGQTSNITTITMAVGSSTLNTEFFFTTVTGDADGVTFLTECTIDTLVDFEGTMVRCQLDNTCVLKTSATTTVNIIDSWSGVPGSSTPMLDMGTSDNQIAIRRYAGGIEIINHTTSEESSIDILAGHIIIAASVTAGSFFLRGSAKLTDNSGVGATVDSADLLNPSMVADQTWEETASDHEVAGSTGARAKTTAANAALIPGTV